MSIARLGNDEGATSIEYALMAALIGLAVIAGVAALGQAVLGLFAQVPAF